MLKALLLDLDKTLCDTNKADQVSRDFLADTTTARFGDNLDSAEFADAYLTGIYRQWTNYQRQRYMPIIESSGEDFFRNQLILDLLYQQGFKTIDFETASSIQQEFNAQRLAAFDYYPGLLDFLQQIRNHLTIVVITNGPEFSQRPKINQVQLENHVDHILIGGLEPEEKPAKSIFTKALQLANSDAHEAIHIGDSLTADVAGANDSGILSVWVQHQNSLSTDPLMTPDYTISHPEHIPELIFQLIDA